MNTAAHRLMFIDLVFPACPRLVALIIGGSSPKAFRPVEGTLPQTKVARDAISIEWQNGVIL